MKVIFKKTGEIKKVSFGYAVNYLFPQGLAVAATKQAIEQLENKQLKEEEKKKSQERENKKLARKFKGEEFVIKKKAGKNGKIFGAITKKELAKKLSLDKKEILLEKAIKKTGSYQIELKFGNQRVKVRVRVEDQLKQ